MTDAGDGRDGGAAGGDRRAVAEGVDTAPVPSNQRRFTGVLGAFFAILAIAYTLFHLLVLNVAPLETWTFRLSHVAGVLVLGYGLVAARNLRAEAMPGPISERLDLAVAALALAGLALGALPTIQGHLTLAAGGTVDTGQGLFVIGAPAMAIATVAAVVAGWLSTLRPGRVLWTDWVLMLSALLVLAYLLLILDRHRFSNGTSFALAADVWFCFAGLVLILELTRRVTGLALVTISVVFACYAFAGPWMPGFLRHEGFSLTETITYIYSDKGVLGPTTAVSSTYIILFIVFAAFLQASRVGDYFVNFAFATAGRARGGPAKVAVFASGLMGMINGTSAGNVVSTGSLTIPLMKKVGYKPQAAGAIEAAASTGGQIMPPIMGAGAFIMAEITGIPYTELVLAAIIPAVLYFASVYFMVDLEAGKLGMRGMSEDELPKFAALLKQVYLFIPIVILIAALFAGYSVIRAGTLSIVAATVVSWLTPYWMGPIQILRALKLGAEMSIQIIAVCACSGLIVGVIALTGVGARFSSLLLSVASSPFIPEAVGMLLAMVFAMIVSIILGMGMPTTAAYAVAASVVAPGLGGLIEPTLVGFADPDRTSRLIAHFFVFYFAVISAITPPVALAAYAAAGISGADAMKTSIASFGVGLAAFVVPFVFFYSPAMLLEGSLLQAAQVACTALIGVYMLSAAVRGYMLAPLSLLLRGALLAGALCMIKGGLVTDVAGIAIGLAVFLPQRRSIRALQPAE